VRAILRSAVPQGGDADGRVKQPSRLGVDFLELLGLDQCDRCELPEGVLELALVTQLARGRDALLGRLQPGTTGLAI
jgi:hypothetical protein